MTPDKDAENKVRDRLRSVTVLGLAKSRFMRKYLPTAARGAGCRRSFGATTSQSRVVNAMRTRLRNSNARQSFVVLRRVGTARPPADGWNLDARQSELVCRGKTDHLPAKTRVFFSRWCPINKPVSAPGIAKRGAATAIALPRLTQPMS